MSNALFRRILEEIKLSLGSYGAAGQLQQRPSPDEGGILKRAWWRWWDADHLRAPHFDQIVQSWDMAFSDTDGSDYVLGQVWGRLGAAKYPLHLLRCRVRHEVDVRSLVAYLQGYSYLMHELERGPTTEEFSQGVPVQLQEVVSGRDQAPFRANAARPLRLRSTASTSSGYGATGRQTAELE